MYLYIPAVALQRLMIIPVLRPLHIYYAAIIQFLFYKQSLYLTDPMLPVIKLFKPPHTYEAHGVETSSSLVAQYSGHAISELKKNLHIT